MNAYCTTEYGTKAGRTKASRVKVGRTKAGRTKASRVKTGRFNTTLIWFVILGLSLPACSLFSTREPEKPLTESGTFIQPDTPEQVVENLQSAIAELNTLNYRRSIAETFVFRPTATAVARESLFSSWSKSQEEQYFSAMAAAAALNSGHSLQLNDQSFTLIGAGEFLLDATYVLTINHRRSEVPVKVKGRLRWLITQASDGLWSLSDWTDQEFGSEASWSDLKAEFMK